MKPLTQHKVRQWMEQFLKLMDKRKRKEVAEEKSEGKVSIKLGLMTGKNELACDFCEVCDHFYPGAVFADVYVNGRLQWMMCPNCLLYCKEQANGSLEQNIRARFHKLAHRLEKAARQARGLAVADEFHTRLFMNGKLGRQPPSPSRRLLRLSNGGKPEMILSLPPPPFPVRIMHSLHIQRSATRNGSRFLFAILIKVTY